jgi:modification methylase
VAKMLGHNYIGIEISDNYIETAENRLKYYKNELSAFKSEIEKHAVRETFKERKDRGVYNHHNKDKKAELKNALFD